VFIFQIIGLIALPNDGGGAMSV